MSQNLIVGSFALAPEDFPLEPMVQALEGIYRNPTQAAQIEQQAHFQFWGELMQQLEPKLNPENITQLAQALETFKVEYLRRAAVVRSTKSGVVSWHIAGGSRYPAKKVWQRMDREQRVSGEFFKWRRVRANQVLALANPPTAQCTKLERLQAELAKRQTRQEQMKQANKMMRQYKGEDSAELRCALAEVLGSKTLAEMLLERSQADELGYPRSELGTNQAAIKRLQQAVLLEQHREGLRQNVKRSLDGVQAGS
jgi:hypothetical protein